jgi:hypothetical protein
VAQREDTVVALLLLNISARWGLAVNATPRNGLRPLFRGLVGLRADQGWCKADKSFFAYRISNIEPSRLQRLAIPSALSRPLSNDKRNDVYILAGSSLTD